MEEAIKTTIELGSKGALIMATVLIPDVKLPDYGYITDIVDIICNSSISIIGVLVAWQLFVKYKQGNEEKKMEIEARRLELENDN